MFSTLNLKMSWNMCKLRPKVRNGQNLPHESLNFSNYFFRSNFTYNFSHISTSLTPDYQNIFFQNIFFVFYSKLQNVCEHVYLASQIVKSQNGRRSNFYMVKWTLIYSSITTTQPFQIFCWTRKSWEIWRYATSMIIPSCMS